MQIVFFLVITMATETLTATTGGTVVLPAHYRDYDTCVAAGNDAKSNKQGWGSITFTCVPAEPNLEIEE